MITGGQDFKTFISRPKKKVQTATNLGKSLKDRVLSGEDQVW